LRIWERGGELLEGPVRSGPEHRGAMAVLEGEPDAEVTFGGGAHGVAGHHPEQLASCRLVRRRHEVVGELGVGSTQLLGKIADDLLGVGSRPECRR
jgi:hypothetical protein